MKLVIVLVIGFVLLTSLSFAGGVTDNNNGNSGDILISTGENNGQNSIGTWADSSAFKGDKGDTGEQGIQGISGLTGDKGEQGSIGEQGLSGIDGKNGLNGKEGLKGADGKKGTDGKDGKQGLRGYTGKGLKNRQEAQLEVRIIDTKHTSWAVYGIYDFSNQISTIGAKCTIKIGKSYEEKLIEQLLKK